VLEGCAAFSHFNRGVGGSRRSNSEWRIEPWVGLIQTPTCGWLPGPVHNRWRGAAHSLHWRPESENVPVRIHVSTLVLAPFCVLGHVDLGSRCPPCFGECVGIVNEKVDRVARR
jgi:hypothetical protein